MLNFIIISLSNLLVQSNTVRLFGVFFMINDFHEVDGSKFDEKVRSPLIIPD